MADATISISKTLQHEGGYVNNPNDRGGPTKYGITQADMPGVDMQTITPAQAIAYYQEHYWKPLYSQIADQQIADKLFDMGVLFGVGTAIRLLQISMQGRMNVVSDGVFGPETLADVNQCADLPTYRSVLYRHAIAVVNANPNDTEFLQGWTNRISS